MKRKFAVPLEGEKLCVHFGHCEKFAIIETEDHQILDKQYLMPPVHEPGAFPQFLAQQGVNVIISGGMGHRAQELFAQNRIQVCVGVNSDQPEKLVDNYLKNELRTGHNLCDH